MKAWLFQDHRQKAKLGDKAPWSVGWIDPEGKRKSKRLGSKSTAEKFARKIEGQLASGTYQNISRASWEDFQAEFESSVLAGMDPGTREGMQYALNHFERIVSPAKMRSITSRTIAEFVAARRVEPKHRPRKPRDDEQGKAPKSRAKAEPRTISPATVNKELRCLRAMLRKAVRWGYLATMPEIEFLREPGKLATYVTPEHFAAMYKACKLATLPEASYPAADWWRGLLMMAYMTGWRIGSLLSLKWENVDLEAATAVSLAADNKGKRDQKIPLHPVVVDHLRKLKSFSPVVFPWQRDRRGLYEAFQAIQKAAAVKLTGPKPWYGFHDLRRAFATMNAATLSADALQALMQHKDYQTTQRYINMARQLNPAVANLYVPNVAAS